MGQTTPAGLVLLARAERVEAEVQASERELHANQATLAGPLRVTAGDALINHLIARSNYSTVVDRVIDALGKVKGAYSLLLLTNEALLGVRDPLGVRPLCIGRLDDAWIITSDIGSRRRPARSFSVFVLPSIW